MKKNVPHFWFYGLNGDHIGVWMPPRGRDSPGRGSGRERVAGLPSWHVCRLTRRWPSSSWSPNPRPPLSRVSSLISLSFHLNLVYQITYNEMPFVEVLTIYPRAEFLQDFSRYLKRKSLLVGILSDNYIVLWWCHWFSLWCPLYSLCII